MPCCRSNVYLWTSQIVNTVTRLLSVWYLPAFVEGWASTDVTVLHQVRAKPTSCTCVVYESLHSELSFKHHMDVKLAE
jgi:hypothetical protein